MPYHADYDKARELAQKSADSTGLLLRLKARDFGSYKGYTWGFVPEPKNQYGRDLEGELITPATKETPS